MSPSCLIRVANISTAIINSKGDNGNGSLCCTPRRTYNNNNNNNNNKYSFWSASLRLGALTILNRNNEKKKN